MKDGFGDYKMKPNAKMHSEPPRTKDGKHEVVFPHKDLANNSGSGILSAFNFRAMAELAYTAAKNPELFEEIERRYARVADIPLATDELGILDGITVPVAGLFEISNDDLDMIAHRERKIGNSYGLPVGNTFVGPYGELAGYYDPETKKWESGFYLMSGHHLQGALSLYSVGLEEHEFKELRENIDALWTLAEQHGYDKSKSLVNPNFLETRSLKKPEVTAQVFDEARICALVAKNNGKGMLEKIASGDDLLRYQSTGTYSGFKEGYWPEVAIPSNELWTNIAHATAQLRQLALFELFFCAFSVF